MGTNNSTAKGGDYSGERCLTVCRKHLEACGVTPLVEKVLRFQDVQDKRVAVVIGQNTLYARCVVSPQKSKATDGSEKGDSVELSTPLHELCKNNLDSLRLLLLHLPKTNKLYLQNSEACGHLDACRYDKVAEILATFEDAVLILDTNNRTPLHCLIKSICVKDICMKPWVPVLSVLLDSGAQLMELDGDKSNICQILQLSAELFAKKTCTDGCQKYFLQALCEYDSSFVQTKILEIAISYQNPVLVKMLLTSNGVYLKPCIQQSVEYEPQTDRSSDMYHPLIYALKQCEDVGESPALLEIVGILASHIGIDIKAPFRAAESGLMKAFSRLIAHPNFESANHNALDELLKTSGLHRPLHLLRGVIESECKHGKPCLKTISSNRLSSLRMPKKAKWRSKIERSFHLLVEDLEAGGEFLDWLVEKGVFGLDMVEIVRSKPTNREKARELLVRAQRLTKDKQEKFCWALRQSNQDHLAELLKGSTAGYDRASDSYSNIDSILSDKDDEMYYGPYDSPSNGTPAAYLTVELRDQHDEVVYENL